MMSGFDRALLQAIDKDFLQVERSPMINPIQENLRPLHGAKLLVAEDHLVNQEVLLGLLAPALCEVVIANNGAEALAILLAQGPFDGVLMDMEMPVLDGYQACKEIRNTLGLTDLPIISISGHSMAEDRERCLEAGANDHCPKPIDPDQLFDLLLHWVGGEGSGLSRRRALNIDIHSLASKSLVFDIDDGLDRVEGNVMVWKKMLSHFLDSEESRMDQIHQSLSEQDYQLTARHLHALEGAAGTVGAIGLAQAALEAELLLEDLPEKMIEYLSCLQGEMEFALKSIYQCIKEDFIPSGRGSGSL